MLTRDELIEKIHGNVLKCGCWVWLLSSLPSGYGRISIGNQKMDYAHRVSYRVFKGEIPEGNVVMHSCDNPRCINPDHLSVGTQVDNMRDCAIKGRVNNGGTEGTKNGRAKLTCTQVAYILESRLSARELAYAFGVSTVSIYNIRRGKTWQQKEPSARKADGQHITQPDTVVA